MIRSLIPFSLEDGKTVLNLADLSAVRFSRAPQRTQLEGDPPDPGKLIAGVQCGPNSLVIYGRDAERLRDALATIQAGIIADNLDLNTVLDCPEGAINGGTDT